MAKNTHASDDRTALTRFTEAVQAADRGGLGPVQDVPSERPPPRLANRGHEQADDRVWVGLAAVNRTMTQPPGVFLSDVARALAQRDGLWLVAGTRAGAVKVIDLLKHPVRRTIDRGARLYKTRGVLYTDGAEVVQPATADPATWLLTPDGQLRLRTGGQTVATAPVGQVNQIDTVDLPRVTKTAPDDATTVWAVTEASGETITTYPDRQSLFDDWQHVRTGLVPTRLTYVDAVRVLRPSSDGPALTPCWLRNDLDIGVPELEDSMRTFLDLYTVQREGPSLPVDTVCNWWYAWFNAQADRSPPGTGLFRLVPDAIAIDSHGDTRRLRDRAWAYPCADQPR